MLGLKYLFTTKIMIIQRSSFHRFWLVGNRMATIETLFGRCTSEPCDIGCFITTTKKNNGHDSSNSREEEEEMITPVRFYFEVLILCTHFKLDRRC